jgi:hypothetical protein
MTMAPARLALGLLALLFVLSAGPSALSQGPIVGPGQPILCPRIATLAVGPATITQIIAPVTGQAISICGWHVTNTGATGTFSLSYGTGSNCGTGTQLFVPPQNVTNTAPATDHIDYAFFTTPVSQAICITPSVATVAAVIYFNQF